MPTDVNKSIVRRYYELVVATGDTSSISEFISPDYAEIYQGVRHQLGIQGARAHVLGIRRAFPDLTIKIDQQLADGDRVVTLVTACGTHEGERLGMNPTGRELSFTTVNLDRMSQGRITEHTGAANLLEPLLQCGALQIADPRD